MMPKAWAMALGTMQRRAVLLGWWLLAGCGAAPDVAGVDAGGLDAPAAALVVDAAPPDAPPAPTDGAAAPDGGAVAPASCDSCHGDADSAAPPRDLDGLTATTEPGVGAHRAHGGTATWHAAIVCEDCHRVPTQPRWDPAFPEHLDGVTGLTFSARAGSVSYDAATATCGGVRCHGAGLGADRGAQPSIRAPRWTLVDGSQVACGVGCHTLPPGGAHPASSDCASCHAEVVASYGSGAVTWARPALHVNGTVEASGGSCTSCHGTEPGQVHPPRGVSGETTSDTLAVGRHVAHLTASATHAAIACETCHEIPTAATLDEHTLGYVATGSLAEAGHHGDVTLRGAAAGMTWDVNATQGSPVVARGTCVGACHSSGRGGAPRVTPYWAGGAWTPGTCDGCHAADPTTGRHPAGFGDHRGLGLTCASCHPAASADTHVDGRRDVHGTVAGSSVTMTPPGGPCGARVTCNGSCHGEGHSNECW